MRFMRGSSKEEGAKALAFDILPNLLKGDSSTMTLLREIYTISTVGWSTKMLDNRRTKLKNMSTLSGRKMSTIRH